MSDEVKHQKVAQPRTKQERKAYIDGYANALSDVKESGITVAAQWVSEMVELEKERSEK